ncbi:MAG: hypothetical protein FJ291_09670 [Planctomycetes bacterium]|nr:hypothetical protein [Planctomycetota bacterium]
MSKAAVLSTLGRPHKAKRNPVGILVLIYRADDGFYWVMLSDQPNVPCSVIEVKRQDADDFAPSEDVDIKSGG